MWVDIEPRNRLDRVNRLGNTFVVKRQRISGKQNKIEDLAEYPASLRYLQIS